MRKTTFSILIVASLLLTMPTTSKAQVTNAITIGNPSCGEWVNPNTPIGMRYNNKSWLFGFISAFNVFYVKQMGKELLSDLVTYDISAWMDKYCKENPLNKISQGVPALYKELATRQKQ